MENSNRGIIKLLDTIPKFETYSQYNSSLEKVFKEYSIQNLIKHLREQKKPKIFSFFNVEEEKPVATTTNIFQAYNIDNKREDLKFNSSNNIFENNIKHNNNEKYETIPKNDTWKIPIIKTRRKYNPELDPFRYNPNYNSIYKNTPSVRIKKPFNETIPIHKFKNRIKMQDKIILRKQNESPFLTEIGGNEMISTFNINNKILNAGNLKLLNNKKNKKINLKTIENDRSNHSLRFDKYVDRKIKKIEVNPNVSYIEPFDYQKVKNKSIDFNKMHSRNDAMFLNLNNIKGPSIGYYNPNYEYFNSKIRNISLGDEIKKEKSKKYLLKQLWGSYGVQVDYQLIDNNKLSNTIINDNN